MNQQPILCLSSADILEAASPGEIIEAVESAFRLYASGEFLMPDRMHIHDRNDNTLLLMPCFTEQNFGTKLVSVFPGNTAREIPVVIGTMVLNDAATGEPLAILNGTILTALRTGAAGAVGIRYTTPPGLSRLGIIGAGVQGLYQAVFISQVRDLSRVTVFDTNPANGETFIREFSQRCPGIPVRAAESVEELLRDSEAAVAATTATRPVLPDQPALLKGKHFVGIGSFRPDMREFPESLFRLVKTVWVDTEHAAEESGDLATPLAEGWLASSQVEPLANCLETPPNINKGDTTLFKSVGMALFDITAAQCIYRGAMEKNLGTPIQL